MKRLAAAVVAAAALAHADAVYFSPRGGCEEALVAAIAAAEESIDVAMYSFTNDRLADALIAAARRGVRVRVLLDEEQLTQRFTQGPRLAASGVNLKIENETDCSLHLKYVVIDNKYAAYGSYNWTERAENKNYEVMVVSQEEVITDTLKRHFETLWASFPQLPEKTAVKKEITIYVSSGKGNRFHRVGCPFAALNSAHEYFIYLRREDALADDAIPCEYCEP